MKINLKMSGAENELEEVKCIIRGLLISSPLATTIHQLEVDYRKEEGCGIPFRKFGYPSLETFLRSIPDTVVLIEPRHGSSGKVIVQPVQSSKSNHVEKLVYEQRRASNAPRRMKRASAVHTSQAEKRSSTFSSKNVFASSFVPMSLRISLNRVCCRYAENGLPLSCLEEELSAELFRDGAIRDKQSKWLPSFGYDRMEDLIQASVENRLIKLSSKNGQSWITPFSPKHLQDNGILADRDNQDSVSLVSDKMKSNFKAVLKKHPKGLWCSLLPKAYKDLTGYNLEVNELGFVSIIQMAMSMKDVFICSRPNPNSDWLLFDVDSNSVWDSPAAPISKEIKRASLPKNIVRNVQALLDDFPRGIIKHKFLLAYKEKYEEDLPMADYGFDNLMAILAHLASQNVIHLRFSGNIPMICSPLRYPEATPLRGLRKDNEFINSLYPRGVLLPSDDIPTQPLPENFSVGCSMDVLVTEVITPSFFWYQLWGSDVQTEFNKMMDELQIFYNPGGPGGHRMPDPTIQIGQFCAVRYPPNPSECGEWHRAQITSLPSLTEVEVFYVDYGSKCKVNRSEIRFLDKKYGELPVQALKASLVNVRPKGFGLWFESELHGSETKPVWSPEACNSFLKLVENQPLVGVVADIDEDVVRFALIDTSKDNDLHINDILVFSNLAEFGEMCEMNERPSRSCNKRSNESSEEILKKIEVETKLPGSRPPSIESNNITKFTTEKNLQFHEWSLIKTSTELGHISPKDSSEVESDRCHSNGELISSMSTRKHLSTPSSLRKISLVPDTSLHPAELTNACRSNNSSPMSLYSPAESIMLESEADVFNLDSTIDSRGSTNPSMLLPVTERSAYRQEIFKMPLEPSSSVSRVSTSTPTHQQIPCNRNLNSSNKGDLHDNLEGRIISDDHMQKLQLELERLQLCQKQLQYQQLQTQVLLLATSQNPSILGNLNVSDPLHVRKVIPEPSGFPSMNPILNAQSNIFDPLSTMFFNQNLLAGSNPQYQVPQSIGKFPPGIVSDPQFTGSQTQYPVPLNYGKFPPGITSYPQYTGSQTRNPVPQDVPQNYGKFPPGITSYQQDTGSQTRIPVPQDVPQNYGKFPSGITSYPQYTGSMTQYTAPQNHGKLPPGIFSKAKFPANLTLDCNNLINSIGSSTPCHSPSFSVRAEDAISSTTTGYSPTIPPNPASSVHESLVSGGIISNGCNSEMMLDVHKFAETGSKNFRNEKSGEVTNLNHSSKTIDLNCGGDANVDDSISFAETTSDSERSTENYRLRTSFEASSIKCDSISLSSHQNCGNSEEEKWKVVFEPNGTDDKGRRLEGILNGKPVQVFRIGDIYYVLTEEILGRFYNSLPVHVAMKIAKLKQNGKEIKSIVINARENKDIYRRLYSLIGAELIDDQSDIHLTSVETLHYLCSSLEVSY